MSDAGPTERLQALLGEDPPPSVLGLRDADRAALADVLEESRRAQDKALQDAFNASLRHVPFPVRGLVKRVLIG